MKAEITTDFFPIDLLSQRSNYITFSNLLCNPKPLTAFHPAILSQPCHLRVHMAKEHLPALAQNFTKEQQSFPQQFDPSLTYKDIYDQFLVIDLYHDLLPQKIPKGTQYFLLVMPFESSHCSMPEQLK